jgi:hypothetical protein
LEHSAGISWLQPAQPVEAEAAAELVEAGAAPDGRSGVLAAAAGVAVGLAEAAARPFGAVEVLASPSADPDAPVAAVAPPGVVARRVEFAAVSEASARPAESAWEAQQRVWVAAVAKEPRLAFSPFPERPALLRGPEPNRELSADPQEVPAHSFPAFSDRWLRGDSGLELPEGSFPTDFEGQVLRWDSSLLERVPSRPGAREAPLSCRGLAGHWPSVASGPEAAH